jgi:8-oxo-dGTP pyrophosphatase MutT (NUDIX family)
VVGFRCLSIVGVEKQLMDKDVAKPRPAATCIVVVAGGDGLEILLTQRSQNLTSFTGMWVFPGGVFEDTDYGRAISDDLEAVGKQAAAREVEEETAVQLDAGTLELFSHWTTPSQLKKRWSTWFYLALLDTRPTVVIDPSEVAASCWLTVNDALQLQANGELPMSPPTLITLNQLADFDSLDAIRVFLESHQVDFVQPRAIPSDEGNWIVQPSDAAFLNGDLSAEGSRDRLLISKGGLSYLKT